MAWVDRCIMSKLSLKSHACTLLFILTSCIFDFSCATYIVILILYMLISQELTFNFLTNSQYAW
jgi:hypothetical protein